MRLRGERAMIQRSYLVVESEWRFADRGSRIPMNTHLPGLNAAHVERATNRSVHGTTWGQAHRAGYSPGTPRVAERLRGVDPFADF